MFSADDIVFSINNDLRTITVPNGYVLGVFHDKNVNTVHFLAPRKYRDIDLSEYTIQINYKNNNNSPDCKIAENIVINDDSIEFDWIAGRNAFLEEGNTVFNVCFRKIDSKGFDTNEFNTTVYSLKILKGLEADPISDNEANDFIAQINAVLTKTSAYAAQLGDLTSAISSATASANSAGKSATAAASSAAAAAASEKNAMSATPDGYSKLASTFNALGLYVDSDGYPCHAINDEAQD